MTTPSSTPFAALLRQLRVFRGVSQQKLADLAHVSVGAVASAEAARSLPSVRTGVALFRALDALEPIDATATTAWAEALDTAEALLRRHQHQVVDAYLASAAAAPTDHAAAARIAAEADVDTARLLLGHTDIRTTLRYLDRLSGKAAKAAARLA